MTPDPREPGAERGGGYPSHLRAALRLAVQGLRARGQPEPPGLVPRRRAAVERWAIPVEATRVRSYLRVTGGEEIPGLQGEDAALSPVFPALWETALALELLALTGGPFPSAGLVHLESEVVHLRPLRVGEQVRCRMELDRVEPHAQGARLTLVSRNWNVQGHLCLQDTMALLVRTRADGAREGPRPPRPAEEAEAAQWREVARWPLRANQGRRYARVSGDFNPIHLWAWSSRLLGYRRPILHGYCLEALVAHALIRHRLGGDPTALRRLQIAFRSPLALPAEAALLVAEGGTPGKRLFRVVGEGAKRPYAEGEWVGG